MSLREYDWISVSGKLAHRSTITGRRLMYLVATRRLFGQEYAVCTGRFLLCQ
jgi:hypothetical protein